MEEKQKATGPRVEAPERKVPVAFRIDPAIKEIAMRRAHAQRRSFAGYIEWLVIKDAEEGER